MTTPNVAILHADLIATAALSGSATPSSLPLANLQDEQPQKIARISDNEGYVQADFGAATALQAVCLHNTNLTATAEWRLRLGADGSTWNTDTGWIGADPSPDRGLAAYLWAAEQTYRYLRIDIRDAALATIDMGLMLAGPIFQPTVNCEYGWGQAPRDLSRRAENPRGSIFVARAPKRRVLALTFGFQSKADIYGDVLAMARTAGESANVLVIPKPGDAYEAQDRIVGLLSLTNAISEDQFEVYRWGFEVTERI